MSVTITVNQAAKPAGVAGQAREDIDVGVGVTLTANGGPFSAYQWTVLHKPIEVRTNARATAVPGTPTNSTTTLTPIDVRGTYLVQVAVNSGAGLGATAADIARITFYAGISGDPYRGAPNADPRLLPRRLPGAGEKGEHNVPDVFDPGGNVDGWAKEFYRWERVWQDLYETKAWVAGRVNLTGAGATLVRGYNVASVTRTAQGLVLVTFTTALPNANYSVIATPRVSGGMVIVSNELTSSLVIERSDIGGSAFDGPFNFRVELAL